MTTTVLNYAVPLRVPNDRVSKVLAALNELLATHAELVREGPTRRKIIITIRFDDGDVITLDSALLLGAYIGQLELTD